MYKHTNIHKYIHTYIHTSIHTYINRHTTSDALYECVWCVRVYVHALI